jgi:hypothetical protein
MRSLLPLNLLILLVSCTPSGQVVESGAAINQEAPYIWESKVFPKTLRISTSFNEDEVEAIKEMGSAWSDSINNTKTFLNVDSTTSNIFDADSPDRVLGIYKSLTWPDDPELKSALAITQLYGRRHNIGDPDEYVGIEHADILVNYASGFEFDATDDGQYDGYDLKTVVLHEMGHFLGLQHIPVYYDRPDEDENLTLNQYKATSVMYPSISGTEVKRSPKPKDIDQLTSKYSISSAVAMAARFKPKANDPGENVKIVIELRANGECLHKENGALVRRHQIKIK